MNAPNRLPWLLHEAVELRAGLSSQSVDRGAIEAWWEIRDLWLRMLQSMSLQAVSDGDAWRLEWRPKDDPTPIDIDLHHACREPERYSWCEDGRRGSMLTGIEAGTTCLTLLLAPDKSLLRWSNGSTVLAELLTFLAIYGDPATKR